MKICKACGKPIKINEKLSEVHEDMHWLCFHLLFEHDDFDPDEACDDPSCPWNRISGKTTHIINHYSDIKVISSDKIAGIFLLKGDCEKDRLPSIEFKLSVVNDMIRNYTDTIWIEKTSLINFLNQLRIIRESLVGNAYIESMSPDELIVNVQNIDSSGHFKVAFSVKDSKYVRNDLTEVKYGNSFELDYTSIELLILDIEKVLADTFEN